MSIDGQTDLVTVDAGSNDLTVISGFEGPDAVFSTIASGGVDPDDGVQFGGGDGFEDLVVGNSGDGELALFEGGPRDSPWSPWSRSRTCPTPPTWRSRN